MRRIKGQGQLDSFYTKVLTACVRQILDVGTQPFVTDWDEMIYFLSLDRKSFQLIKKDKYCLSKDYINSCEQAFSTQEKYVKNLYYGDLIEVIPSGNKYTVDNGIDEVVELKCVNKVFYIKGSALELFPKQRIYCISDKPNSPIFILSSLKLLLGGVWPLSGFKKV